MKLHPRWYAKINWGGPKERPTEVCSICAAPLPETPLMLWKADGSGAAFCARCERLLVMARQ